MSPAAPRDTAACATPGDPDADAATAPPEILVVDDDEVVRTILEQQLRRLGYAACLCAGASDALWHLPARPWGLVLTDVNMPGVDGLRLARMIREWESTLGPEHLRLPIIAMTASDACGSVVATRAAGIDACLEKPIELAALRAAIRRWLSDRG